MEINLEKSNHQNNITKHTGSNVLNYINIIENINQVIKTEGYSETYFKMIQSSCNKIKEIINYDINEIEHHKNICKIPSNTCCVFNIYDKIKHIIKNYEAIIKHKILAVNYVDVDESILINNNELLIDKLFSYVINDIISSIPNNSNISIMYQFNYPYVLIKIAYIEDSGEKFYIKPDFINDIINELKGKFSQQFVNHNNILNFYIPIHSDIIDRIFND